MRSITRSASVVLVALACTSCTFESPLAPALDVEHTTFASSLGIDLTTMTKTASGLYYQNVTVGAGAPTAAGNHVTVHYSGYLANGTEFDSSIGKTPFGFTLGAEQVIKGWDEGMLGVRVGGTRKLVIPSELAYGGGSVGAIPPNSVLVFTVQLISIP
ncbi:MAG: FKBP-type peptidyl-prolyl cis-trans isomerase [Gemmatimonadetes bacterium]|nr:FKBP-type peptidyl-prolyl cis-trans isomerase [Gemmatimonadota bacterium]